MSVLSIAGSDSGGGAGIQADLRTFAAYGVHGLTAITAVTAQHTRAVVAVHAIPLHTITRQVEAAFEDFRVGAVKIGMLGTAAIVRTVARALAAQRRVPIVLDPVMVASSGARLLQSAALRALREQLLPHASVLTPNLPEAALLCGHDVRTLAQMRTAARSLLALGPGAVLVKGGHLERGTMRDLFLDRAGETVLRHSRLALSGHGTGCTLSSAIAAQLALGIAPLAAVRDAIDYVHGALRHAYRPGRGTVAVLNHGWRTGRD